MKLGRKGASEVTNGRTRTRVLKIGIGCIATTLGSGENCQNNRYLSQGDKCCSKVSKVVTISDICHKVVVTISDTYCSRGGRGRTWVSVCHERNLVKLRFGASENVIRNWSSVFLTFRSVNVNLRSGGRGRNSPITIWAVLSPQHLKNTEAIIIVSTALCMTISPPEVGQEN